MSFLALALIGMSGWRLAYFLVNEAGPFNLVVRLRLALWRDGNPVPFIGDVLTCIHCTAFWTTLAAWGVYEFEPRALVPLAAWGVTNVIATATRY